MMEWFSQHGFSSTAALVILVLAALQITLMVAALIALLRTRDPKPWGLSKALWIVIIIVANMLGSILALIAVARSRQASPPPANSVAPGEVDETIDRLYSERTDA